MPRMKNGPFFCQGSVVTLTLKKKPKHSAHHKSTAGHHPVKAGMFDLVALDVDGTLLRSDKRMGVATINAIQKAVRQGVRVVLASARPPRSTREIHNLLKLDTWLINYNGALIHDVQRKRHVFHQPLEPELAQRVVKTARKADPKVVVSLEILDKWYTDHLDESLPTETSRSFVPDFIGPLSAFLHVPVTKVMLLAPPARLRKIRTAIDAKLAGEVAVTVSDAHLIQVIHPEVNKGVALARVAEAYGVPRDRVMAIGDAPNDVGMLQWAGLGVAVGNAWPAVRDAADVTVSSNDDDGVAEAFQRFALR